MNRVYSNLVVTLLPNCPTMPSTQFFVLSVLRLPLRTLDSSEVLVARPDVLKGLFRDVLHKHGRGDAQTGRPVGPEQGRRKF